MKKSVKYKPREFNLPENPRIKDGCGQGQAGCERGGRIERRQEALDSTYLDFSPQDDICITRISETKNSAKLVRSEIADVANFKLWGLAHDRYDGDEQVELSSVMRGRTNGPGCPSLVLQPRSCLR